MTDIEASRATGEGLKGNLNVHSIEEVLDASENLKRAKDVAASACPDAYGDGARLLACRLRSLQAEAGGCRVRAVGAARERG